MGLVGRQKLFGHVPAVYQHIERLYRGDGLGFDEGLERPGPRRQRIGFLLFVFKVGRGKRERGLGREYPVRDFVTKRPAPRRQPAPVGTLIEDGRLGARAKPLPA